jgi:hypothetical protein
MAALRSPVAVRRLSSGDVGDGRHDLRRDTNALAAVVRCGLVRVRHQERASALGLQPLLGLGGYETAWTWLHKRRRAMVDPTASASRAMSRSTRPTSAGQSLAFVVAAPEGRRTWWPLGVECEGAGSGRVRLARIGDASSRSLHPFVRTNIEPGAVLLIDAWQGYAGIDRAG